MSSLSGSKITLAACPPKVLKLIIKFLDLFSTRPYLRYFLNLRLVNHDFNRLIRPFSFQLIFLPPNTGFSEPPVTSDARQLLRLIDNDPTLASCIQCLTYEDPDDSELPLTDEYSLQQLTHDHKIFSQFSAELAEKSSSKNTFGYSRKPSKLRKMSVVYNKACIPILISRLPYLRTLVFRGRLGGKHSYLLTSLAKDILQCMTLKSLRILDWCPETNPLYIDFLNRYEDRAYDKQPKPIDDEWDAVTFLQLTPMLQHLKIFDDAFLKEPSRNNIPMLEYLTSFEWNGTEDKPLPKDASHGLVEFLKFTPRLRRFTCRNLREPRFDLQQLQKALRHIRATLKKISTDILSLIPPPNECPTDFSLLDSLPVNLESLHFSDQGRYFCPTRRRDLGTGRPIPDTSDKAGPTGLFFRILEDLALSKTRGPFTRLNTSANIRRTTFDWLPRYAKVQASNGNMRCSEGSYPSRNVATIGVTNGDISVCWKDIDIWINI
ncbi:hypothetical protein BZA77DRAFT_296872 [Pyronema omphalodes]|nr:hypothetical protein BZA77DRAFT_296872 [Pyronema omphalodes]